MALSLRKLALENNEYRVVLSHLDHSKVTVMCLTGEIPAEIHADEDQLLYVVEGGIIVTLYDLHGRVASVDNVYTDQIYQIRAGVMHRVNVIRGEGGPYVARLFSIYSGCSCKSIDTK